MSTLVMVAREPRGEESAPGRCGARGGRGGGGGGGRMFVDLAVVNVDAGDGGSGAEAFRRGARVPRGGPSGGDGGKGGDVILRADEQLTTLLDFRYKQHYRAERGQHGMGKKKTGRDGTELVLRRPSGTTVAVADTGVQRSRVS